MVPVDVRIERVLFVVTLGQTEFCPGPNPAGFEEFAANAGRVHKSRSPGSVSPLPPRRAAANRGGGGCRGFSNSLRLP